MSWFKKIDFKKEAKTYYQEYKTKDYGFSVADFDEGQERFEFVRALFEEAPNEKDYLAYLGAGPLEDIDTVQFLKWLQKQKEYSRDSEVDKKLCYAMTMMYWTTFSLDGLDYMTRYVQYHQRDWIYNNLFFIKDLYFHIEDFKPDRWQEYKAIRLEALKTDPQAFGTSLQKAENQPEEEWRKRLQEAESGESYLYFARHKIVENDNKPTMKVVGIETIGMIGAYFPKKETGMARIVGVFVRPAFRHQGVASVMLWYLLQKLKKDSRVTHVKLTANADQNEAIKLYEKFGFQKTGNLQSVMGDGKGHEEYEMEVTL